MADQIRLGQAIDAVLSQLYDAPNFRRPDEQELGFDETTVWDGPQWHTSEDHAPGAHLVIGWSGDGEEPTQAAATTWTAGPIAASTRARDETTVIQCIAVSQHHDTPKEARDSVLGVVSQVGVLCRSLPDLGIDSSTTIGGVRTVAQLNAGTFSQWLERGFTAQLEFTVTYQTRV